MLDLKALPRMTPGRRIAAYCVVGLSAGVGIHFLHDHQARRSASALLAQARRAEERGRADKAVKFLDRYLGYVPGDLGALTRYGLVLDRLGEVDPEARRKAVLAFEKVLIRDPGDKATRLRLAGIYVAGRQFDEARDHLAILQTASPADPEIAYLSGEAAEGRSDPAASAGWYRKAIDRGTKHIEAYERLATLLWSRLGRQEDADKVLAGMIAAHGDSPRARLSRAAFRRRYHLEGAEQDVARARELAPDDAEVLLASADLAAANGDHARARGDLERGLKLHPREPRLYLALADLEAKSDRADRAEEILRGGMKVVPVPKAFLWALADLQILTGRADSAAQTIQELRTLKVPEALLSYLQAGVLMVRGDWDRAARELEDIRPALAALPGPALTREADLFLGRCYEHLGDAARCRRAYERAVAADPTWAPALLALGSALASSGHYDAAIDRYQRVASGAPRFLVVVARLMMLRDLRLPEPERRWGEIEKVLDAAEAKVPGSADVPLLRAEVLVARGQAARARTLIEAACKADPTSVELRIARAALVGRREGAPAALALLDQEGPRFADRADYWSARLDATVKAGGADLRGRLAGLGREIPRFPAADQALLLGGLARAHQQLGDLAEAKRLWTLAAGQAPAEVGPRVALFDLAEQAGDDAGMGEALARIRQVEGEGGTFGKFCEARRLIARARSGDRPALDGARSLLVEVAERQPTWPRVPLALAAVAELRDDDAAVLGHLRRAIDLGDRDPLIIRRTVQLLHRQRRHDEADRMLREIQEQAPIAGDLRRLVAEVSLQGLQFDGAAELARRAIPADSRDYRDHLWLGEVLQGSRRGAEAEPELRRAVALAEAAPEAWVALVRNLAARGRKAEAEAAIADARRKLPAKQAPLALALCDDAVGRIDRAESEFRDAIRQAPDDVPTLRALANFDLRHGREQEARDVLRKIIDGRDRSPEDAAWATRVLASVLGVGGDAGRSREAIELLGTLAGGSNPAETAQDLRLKASLLAARGGREGRKEAIRVVRDLIARDGSRPEDRFLLAKLSEADGDWPAARREMLDLVRAHGENLRYLTFLARGLLEHQEVEAAAPWVDALARREPSSFRAAVLRARLLKARHEDGEAAACLLSHAQAVDARPDAVGAVLEEIGRFDAAESMYRTAAAPKDHPESALALARFLARRGRVDEALGVCESAWRTCPPEVVAKASVAVLEAARVADDATFRRVAGRIEEAMRKSPDLNALRTQLGTLRLLQGHADESESLLREAIRRDGRDVLALNALAWLLTLRGTPGAEALGLINRAIEIAGPDPGLLDTRGLVHLQAGRADAALDDLKDAANARPTAVRSFHLSRAHWLANDQAAAASALRDARARGLTTEGLHPSERAAYDRLRAALELH